MKRSIIRIVLLITLILPAQDLFATGNQTEAGSDAKVLTGTVVDKISGETLPGARITIEGKDEVYYADLDGSFNVPCPSSNSGLKLVVSHVSYKTYEEQVNPADENRDLTVQLRR